MGQVDAPPGRVDRSRSLVVLRFCLAANDEV
jgi:hypothetical protein